MLPVLTTRMAGVPVVVTKVAASSRAEDKCLTCPYHSDKADSFGVWLVPSSLVSFGTNSTASRVLLMPVR